MVVYNVTLTWSHAVVVIRVYTVETGILLVVTLDFHSMIDQVIFMNPVRLREWTCVAGTMLICHLVYIAVIFKLMQSIMTVISELEKHSMSDCMPVEVRNGICCTICTCASFFLPSHLSFKNMYLLFLHVGDIEIQDIAVQLGSDLNGASPQFTLTCISTGGPATTVSWARDSATVTVGAMTVLDNTTTAQYTHTLTVTGRLGGLYQCAVANAKPSSDSASLTVLGIYTDNYVIHTFCYVIL